MKHKDNFKIEETIPRNYLNVYLSFVSIISVSKEVNLQDIQVEIEKNEIGDMKFSSWFSWN
ncbi:MAG: hypothetical protein K9H26_15670 [Prolixibacteraceae bacterium]|nr:hypothetical protein [Prolixibacteraceae bacterium]